MFWRRKGGRAEPPRVGFYGKLPQFADFVQSQASQPEVRALDEWLSAGLTSLERAASGAKGLADITYDYPEAPPVEFLFHAEPGATAAHCLAGTLAPSEDQSGRRYPFALFASMPCEQDATAHVQLLLAMTPFLERADAWLEGAPACADPAELSRRAEALVKARPDGEEPGGGRGEGAALSDSYRPFLRQLAVPWLADCFGGGAAASEALARLWALCEPLIGRESTRPPLLLRVPLERRNPRLACAFWLDLLWRALGWKARAPIAFWTPHADRPYLLASLGRPTGRAFLHLLRDDVTDEHLCDLTADGASDTPTSNAGTSPLGASASCSLEDLLRRATHER